MTTNQTDKQTKVKSLVQELSDDLSSNTLSDAHRRAKLEELKVYGRDPTGADAIYCRSGLTTLSKYAFGTYTPAVVQEALRVIANALLLQPDLRVALIDLDGLAQVSKIYQNQNDDFEFLGARVLFICTYAAEADYKPAFSADLLQSIEQHLKRHATQLDGGQTAPAPMELMAINETAKLIFNLDHKYPEECKSLNVAIPDICTILQYCKPTTPPLGPPTGSILNALACLDFGAVPAQSSNDNATNTYAGVLITLEDILSRSLEYYEPVQLDVIALSLLTIARMLYDTSSPSIQVEMQRKLLPADSERDLPLGQSTSLASRLLRLTTSPGLSNLPEAISGLLFEMSDKNAAKFVKNIGYGYAAGYLTTHNIPIPESIHNRTTIGSAADQIPINPVTGQRLDRESVPDLPEMTEEEKEREAERLFVLFERLQATGVANVQNPVRQAMEEGQLTETSDSDSDPE